MTDPKKIRRWKPTQVLIALLLVLVVGGEIGAFIVSQNQTATLRADQHAQAVKTKVIERRLARIEGPRVQPARSRSTRRETPAQTRSRTISGRIPSRGVSGQPSPARQPATITQPARPSAPGPAPGPAPAGGAPAVPQAPTVPQVVQTVQQVVKQTAPAVCQPRLPVVGSVCGP